MKRKHILVIFLILCLSLSICGCGSEQESETGVPENEAVGPVELIHLEGEDWGYPSPYAHYPRGPGSFKMCLIFDSLLERGENGLIPWLAEDYEIQADGKEYLFTIRDGVTWHDDTALSAEDVKFSFEYASEHPMISSHFSKKDIEKVEVVGDNQVLITVTNPNASMLYNLGLSRIIPQHIWEKVENPKEYTAAEAVIGSGPYCLTDYNKEHGTYRFEAYENFWGPQAAIKVLEFIPVSEPILAFEQGEIDLSEITPDVLSRFENNSEYKIVKSPAFWGYRMIFNMVDNPPLQQRELRQAISYAIDSEELIEKIERGAGVPGSAGILPPDHVMYNPELQQYALNLEGASKLLEDLGYDRLDENGVRYQEGGDKLSFTLSVPLSEDNAAVRLAEVIKEQLGKAGIEIIVQSADRKTHDSRVINNEYQLAIHGHGGWGNDADYLYERFGGESKGGISPSSVALKAYKNEKLSELLAKQRMEMDNEIRKAIVYEIQEILAQDVPEIPLYYTTSYSVYRPDKYDGWMFMYDHHSLTHSKLSYLIRD